MPMNPKDFTVEAAKSYLEKEYPFTDVYKNLTESDKIYNEKLANAAREKIKNPSSKVWDFMVKEQAIIGGDKFPLSPENTKALGRAVEDDVIAKAIEASKERSARGLEKNLVSSTAGKAAPMETPYGKSLLSYTPEGKIAGKTGAALRGLGKVASRVAGPLGAALTAIDLGQALSEIQDKGAAKIAEDYKNSQPSESEDTGDKMMMKMEPMERGLQKAQEYMTALKKDKQYSPEENVPSSAKSQLVSGARRDYQSSKYSGNPSMKNESTAYSPEERAKLKEMLSKYRATPTLR